MQTVPGLLVAAVAAAVAEVLLYVGAVLVSEDRTGRR